MENNTNEIKEKAPRPRKPRTKNTPVVVTEVVFPSSIKESGKNKSLFASFGAYILIVVVACFMAFQQVQLARLTSEVNLLTLRVVDLLGLEDYRYVTDNKLVINDRAKLFLLGEPEYIVYFYNLNCDYCKDFEKNVLIPFIRGGYTDNIKIYFVNLDENEFLYATEEQYERGFIEKPTPQDLYILGTPTALWIKDGAATVYLGSDKIPALLKQFTE